MHKITHTAQLPKQAMFKRETNDNLSLIPLFVTIKSLYRPRQLLFQRPATDTWQGGKGEQK